MKNYFQYLFLLATFWLGSGLVFSQPLKKDQNDLLKRAIENKNLLETNSEKAFEQAKDIEKEAQKIKAKEAELLAIYIQFGYYKNHSDFEKMLLTTQLLYQKAIEYKKPIYQAISKRGRFDVFFYNELYEKAYLELEEGMKILNKIDNKDSITIITKANFYVGYANYHRNSDVYKRLEYTKLAGNEIKKHPEYKSLYKNLQMHYYNLAISYIELDQIDSARHYVKLSQSNENEHSQTFVKGGNLLLLGQILIKEEKYKEALTYLKEAERIEGYINHINSNSIYENIILSYQKLNEKDSVRLYQIKKDSLSLNVSESQNKSLHKLLEQKEKSWFDRYFYVLVLLFALMILVTLTTIRKNRLLVGQEKISKKYLDSFSENQSNDESYSKLLQMFKANDSAFMLYFDEVFPDFTSKLLGINSKIIPSDIEFCALLKLKVSTDNIARYKNITTKSVQNRKYNIRKKLNIPAGVDIYNWFNSF